MSPSPSPPPQAAGVTLVELLVVLVVLVVLTALAGLIVANLGTVADTARRDGTLSCLAAVRDAILGRARLLALHGTRLARGLPDDVQRRLRDRPAGRIFGRLGAADDPGALDGWSTPLVLQIPDPDGEGTLTDDDLRHARLVSAGPDTKLETRRTDATAPLPATRTVPRKRSAATTCCSPCSSRIFGRSRLGLAAHPAHRDPRQRKDARTQGKAGHACFGGPRS